ERHLRETLEAASAHDLSAQSDDVHQAIEAARLAEEARDAALAAQAEVRAELARATEERDETRATLERLREELARAQAERRNVAAERDRVGAELSESRAHDEEIARRLAERDHELGRIRSEHAREVATAEERLEGLGAEGAKLRAALAAVEVGRDRAVA